MSLKPKQMITYLLEKCQLTSIGAHISKSAFSISQLACSEFLASATAVFLASLFSTYESHSHL